MHENLALAKSIDGSLSFPQVNRLVAPHFHPYPGEPRLTYGQSLHVNEVLAALLHIRDHAHRCAISLDRHLRAVPYQTPLFLEAQETSRGELKVTLALQGSNERSATLLCLPRELWEPIKDRHSITPQFQATLERVQHGAVVDALDDILLRCVGHTVEVGNWPRYLRTEGTLCIRTPEYRAETMPPMVVKLAGKRAKH